MTLPVKVDLEPYANLRAEIDAGEPLEAVIDREGISPEAWSASQAFWLKQMADEAENKRFETTTRYQTLYRTKKKLADAAMRQRKRDAARVEIPEPPVAHLTAAEQELSARPAINIPAMALIEPPVVAKSVATPSFLERPAASSQASAAPMPPARIATSMPSAAVQSVALPATPPAQVAPPSMVSRLADLNSSKASDPKPPQNVPHPREVTPPAAQPRQVQPPAAQPPMQPPIAQPQLAQAPPANKTAGRTMAIDIEQLMASAVPFGLDGDLVQPPTPPSSAPQPPTAVPPANTPSLPAAAPRTTSQGPPPQQNPPVPTPKKESLMSTMMVDLDQLMAKATPFGGGTTQTIREEDRPKMTSGMPFASPSGGDRRDGVPPSRPADQQPAFAQPAAPQPPSQRSPAYQGGSQEPARPPQRAEPARVQTPQPFPALSQPGPARVASLSQTVVPDDDDPRTMMLADGASPVVGSAGRPLPFDTTRLADAPAIPSRDAPPPQKAGLPFSSQPQSSRNPGPAAGAPASRADAKIFSINQFASLTAEIAEHPEKIEDVRRKYGVTEAQHRAESQRWTEEFAMSSELRQRYFGIVSRYREYLRKKP